MGITIEQTVYEPIPTGKYAAKIAEVEQVEGQFGQQLKFKFDLTTPEGEERTLTGWASMKFSSQSKLYDWVQAAIYQGGAIPREYNFNSDDMIGRKVYITVLEKQGDKGAFNSIDSVLPYVKPSTQAVPPPPPPDDDY